MFSVFFYVLPKFHDFFLQFSVSQKTGDFSLWKLIEMHWDIICFFYNFCHHYYFCWNIGQHCSFF